MPQDTNALWDKLNQIDNKYKGRESDAFQTFQAIPRGPRGKDHRDMVQRRREYNRYLKEREQESVVGKPLVFHQERNPNSKKPLTHIERENEPKTAIKGLNNDSPTAKLRKKDRAKAGQADNDWHYTEYTTSDRKK